MRWCAHFRCARDDTACRNWSIAPATTSKCTSATHALGINELFNEKLLLTCDRDKAKPRNGILILVFFFSICLLRKKLFPCVCHSLRILWRIRPYWSMQVVLSFWGPTAAYTSACVVRESSACPCQRNFICIFTHVNWILSDVEKQTVWTLHTFHLCCYCFCIINNQKSAADMNSALENCILRNSRCILFFFPLRAIVGLFNNNNLHCRSSFSKRSCSRTRACVAGHSFAFDSIGNELVLCKLRAHVRKCSNGFLHLVENYWMIFMLKLFHWRFAAPSIHY